MSKISKSNIGTIKRNKRRAYIEVLLVVFIFGLFICSHFLTVISNRGDIIWMGIDAGNLLTDIVLYFAIFLTIILFILILHRNFIVRGDK